MNVVIAGMGEVGLHVAQELARQGHHLTVIDLDPAAIDRAEGQVDALTLTGPADGVSTLREARVGKANLFAALTSSGPVNLVAAMQARQMGAGRTIARVSGAHYFEDPRGLYPGYLGVDLVVNEQFIVAAELQRVVRARAASAVEIFADGRIELLVLGIEEDAPGVNRPLGEVRLPPGVRVVALERRKTVLIPNVADRVQVGDRIVCVGPTEAIPAVEHLFAHQRQRFNQRTFIVGGGGSGLALARALEREGTRVALIERDADTCRQLAQELRKTEVLHGDGTDVHLLEESGVETADVFCAVSGLDEVNLMAALLARDLGAERCITLVHKPDYVTVCRRLGLEINISPRLLVARELIKQLAGDALVDEVPVLDGQGSVMELVVAQGHRIAGRALDDVEIARGAVVAARVTDDGVEAPGPRTTFQPGDRVIAFAGRDQRAALLRLFRRPLLAGGSR